MIGSLDVFLPNNKFLLAWKIIQIMLIIILLLTVPLVYGFELEIKTYIEGLFILSVCLFSCDIFVSLNTGYYFYGDIVMNRTQITKHYFKKYFIYNLCAIISLLFVLITKQHQIVLLICYTKLFRFR